jgi:hypothetical protein
MIILLVASCATGLAHTYAHAQSFCLSDEELKELSVGATLRSLGTTLGTCIRRFPSLFDRGFKTYNEFVATYATPMRRNGQFTSVAFQKPGRGIALRDQLYDQAEINARKIAEEFSGTQCMNVLVGFEAMVVARNFSVVEIPARMELQQWRSKIPRC